MNTEKEIWKPVVGYEEQYEVSINGVVKGIDRMTVTKTGLRSIKGRILKTRINNDGYIDVRLSKNGRTTTTFIHILLAKAFIPNPINKLEVNHKNGIKTDNRIDNLEWCTHSENMIHAYKMGLLKPLRKHIVDNCTGKRYLSTYEAAIDLKISYGTCRNYLNGNSKNKTCLEYAT